MSRGSGFSSEGASCPPNAGNRLTRTDKRIGTTLTYGYDNIYQLKTAAQGTTTKESYTYDLVGNRLSSLNVSPYNYNPSNELTSTPSGSYTYDNNGNRKSDSTGAQYTWDFENHLTQVVLPSSGGTVNFKYDPFGRRIQKAFSQNSTTTTTDYLYDRSDVLETVNPNGTVLARHVDGPSIDEPLSELVSGVTSYYEQDGLGSVSSLSNSSGALANTYTYDSYGKLTASTGTIANPFQYTGREFDPETGAYYYRARYLDPPTGRFLSEDPIGFGGGVNFYPYVLNNPVTLRDPAGKNAGVIAIPASEWVGGALCFGSGVCETVIVVGGVAVAVAATGYVIYNYFDNSDASDGAQSNSEPSSCKRDKRDPCEGLRLQLAAHQAKLAAYASNPYANDNRSILGQGYDDSIIAGRIKHLVHEIQELQKQLEECERLNGSQ